MSLLQTPNMVRATESGSIPQCTSFTIQNLGEETGKVFDEKELKAGETINFAAQNGRFYDTVAYDATGTEFLILYNV